jgi:hypothetical protein
VIRAMHTWDPSAVYICYACIAALVVLMLGRALR